MFFVFWLFLAALVGFLANSRGRSGFGYFLLSAVCSPLLGLIIVLVTNDLSVVAAESLQRQARADAELQQWRTHEKQMEALRVATLTTKQTEVARPESVADELLKLAGLRDKGILTSEEFERQKKVLLKV